MFAPVPPTPDGLDIPLPDGAVDFHDLFEEGAAWQDALANLDAVKLHSWMIRHYLTDDELIRISDFLNANDVALIIEAEPLDPPDPAECDHTESYEGPYEIENAQRLSDLGVEVAAYAVEQPFSYGYKLEGPGACRYDLDRVLSEVVAWADDLRAIYPDIPIGSIEALWDLPTDHPRRLRRVARRMDRGHGRATGVPARRRQLGDSRLAGDPPGHRGRSRVAAASRSARSTPDGTKATTTPGSTVPSRTSPSTKPSGVGRPVTSRSNRGIRNPTDSCPMTTSTP